MRRLAEPGRRGKLVGEDLDEAGGAVEIIVSFPPIERAIPSPSRGFRCFGENAWKAMEDNPQFMYRLRPLKRET